MALARKPAAKSSLWSFHSIAVAVLTDYSIHAVSAAAAAVAVDDAFTFWPASRRRNGWQSVRRGYIATKTIQLAI